MELTRLGVVIDPTEAQEGASRAKRAAKDMAESISRDLDKVERESKAAGKTVGAAGEKIETSLNGVKAAGDRLGNSTGIDRMARNVGAGFGGMRRMIVDFLDVFGLLDSRFGTLVRRGDSLLSMGENASRAMANVGQGASRAAGGVGELATGTAGAAGGMGRMLASAGPLIGILAAIAAALLAAVVAAKAFSLAIAFTTSSVREAAALEQYTVRLAVLQGSFEKAAETVKRFNSFSDSTPFTDAEVFDAGTKLEAMSKGALATDEALRAIGGSAFVAGKQFSEIAELVGRSYNALRLGLDFIEPLKTMNSYGLIAGETVKEVIRLGEAAEKTGNKAANFAQQWALVYGDLQTKQEALILASNTWEGKMSTIEGKWSALKAAFGEPIMNALKPLLDDILLMIQVLTPMAERAGIVLGNMAKAFVQLFHEGSLSEFFLASFLDATETIARFMLSALLQTLSVVANTMFNLFMLPFRLIADGFKALLADPQMIVTFNTNIHKALLNAAIAFWNYLLGKIGEFGSQLKAAATSAFNIASGVGLVKAIGGAFAGETSAPEVLNNATGKAIGLEAANGVVEGLKSAGEILMPVTVNDPNFVGPPKPEPANDYFSTSLFPTDWMEKQALVTDRTAQVLEGAIQRFDLANPAPAIATPPPAIEDPNGNGTGTGTGTPSASAKKIESISDVLKEERTAVQQLTDDWLNLERQADQAIASMAQGISGEITNALTDAIMGTKSWQAAFEELGLAVAKQIIQMVTQMWIQYTIALLLKNVMGAIPGVGGLFGGATAAVLHSGGTTEGAPRRSGIPLYHSGGRASSERVAMLERDETVLTAEQGSEIRDRLRKSGGGGNRGRASGSNGSAVTILNVTDSSQVLEAIAKNPDAIVNAINSRLPAVRRLVSNGERR